MDAGDISLIVDACHAAASVEEELDFKPGPMGSRGLGQLAYDKGMRILAASQVADVALESRLVKHGLLTYALVLDGLVQGRADFEPEDGRITLSEWLAYGLARVPSLADEIIRGEVRAARGIRIPKSGRRITQQPALFDFARRQGEVLLDLR